MKIVHIVPGAGGTFYCPNCLRDCALVRALRQLGHEVTMVPMYLPVLVDADGIAGDVPVFFGGVNVYLQQQFKLFRKTPRWLDKLFDSSWVLRQAAAREGSTEAAGLGPMTLSMLQGAAGNQKKELDRLIHWLTEHEKPDVVHISNSLLLGLAPELKRALNVPVVCTLQDEESWLDHIDEPYDRMCWEAMSAHANDVDGFIAVSHWYAKEMHDRMGIDNDKMRVVPLGIDLDGQEPASLSFDPPVIGYLSRMTESLGLGLNCLVPLKVFLAGNLLWNYVAPCVLVMVPMFFAGVIFALSFRDSTRPGRDFGANIAGAVLGGLAEYTSMALGFRYLLLVAIALYALSAVFRRSRKVPSVRLPLPRTSSIGVSSGVPASVGG